MARRGFCPCRFNFIAVLLLFAPDAEDVTLRHNLPLRFSGDLLHEVDHTHEHGLALRKGLLLLVGADEDKLRVLLTGTTFHLDQGSHRLNLVEADDLIAS